jgi:acetyl esterase/lipase
MRSFNARSVAKWAGVLAVVLAIASIVSCGGVAFTVANAPTLLGDFQRQADVSYGPHARQRLDWYRPDASEARPIVVFWYGGGWVRGNKSSYRFVGAALAEAGYVAVLPDYRLYPDVKFPAFVEDGAAAVRWARDNAAAIGGDPNNIFLAGHSAGAHTAAMLALDVRWLQNVNVDRRALRGWIGLSGPYVLTPNTPALNEMFGGAFGEKDWRPIEFVSPQSPPALLLHSEGDQIVWSSHATRLAEALRAVGAPVELQLLPGDRHSDTVAALSRPVRGRAPTLAAMQAFIGARIDPSR